MRTAVLAVALCIIAPALAAQELERPKEWKVRFDRPNANPSGLYFVNMPPGWHITTGPAGILYDPGRRAAGEYRVQSKIHLFPGDRREGFGVFIGGRDLTEDSQSYTYFLIRKDGRFLIKRRSGTGTQTVTPWTDHPAIVKHLGGEDPVENVLAVEVGTNVVEFYVNGEKVTSLPRSNLDVEGIVGLRINHRLNLHVTELTVEPKGVGGR